MLCDTAHHIACCYSVVRIESIVLRWLHCLWGISISIIMDDDGHDEDDNHDDDHDRWWWSSW